MTRRHLAGMLALGAAGGALGCRAARHRGDPSILLYDGPGTSPNDVRAFEAVLRRAGLGYWTVNAAELGAMGEAGMRRSRLTIVPGGNYIDIGNGLGARTAADLRNAVSGGLNYLGVCAGAFLAGDFPNNGLNLTGGARFGFYSAERRGVRKAALAIAFPEGATADHYWEDGPELSGWGAVAARYPDGTPAIVEGRAGRGWVILAGFHPEAPESWRQGLRFGASAEADNAFAQRLIRAALDGKALPRF